MPQPDRKILPAEDGQCLRNCDCLLSTGFRVLIHGQNESTGLMSNAGFLVPAGSKTDVAIKHTKVKPREDLQP